MITTIIYNDAASLRRMAVGVRIKPQSGDPARRATKTSNHDRPWVITHTGTVNELPTFPTYLTSEEALKELGGAVTLAAPDGRDRYRRVVTSEHGTMHGQAVPSDRNSATRLVFLPDGVSDNIILDTTIWDVAFEQPAPDRADILDEIRREGATTDALSAWFNTPTAHHIYTRLAGGVYQPPNSNLLAETSRQLRVARADNVALYEQIERLRETLTQVRKERAARIDNLKEALTEERARTDLARTTATGLRDDVKRLKGQVENLHARLEQKNARIDELVKERAERSFNRIAQQPEYPEYDRLVRERDEALARAEAAHRKSHVALPEALRRAAWTDPNVIFGSQHQTALLKAADILSGIQHGSGVDKG